MKPRDLGAVSLTVLGAAFGLLFTAIFITPPLEAYEGIVALLLVGFGLGLAMVAHSSK